MNLRLLNLCLLSLGGRCGYCGQAPTHKLTLADDILGVEICVLEEGRVNHRAPANPLVRVVPVQQSRGEEMGTAHEDVDSAVEALLAGRAKPARGDSVAMAGDVRPIHVEPLPLLADHGLGFLQRHVGGGKSAPALSDQHHHGDADSESVRQCAA